MEATTEKNEYKLKDFLLDVFAKYKINIKKQDFDTILILEEDNKEFRAGRDLEEKEDSCLQKKNMYLRMKIQCGSYLEKKI